MVGELVRYFSCSLLAYFSVDLFYACLNIFDLKFSGVNLRRKVYGTVSMGGYFSEG